MGAGEFGEGYRTKARSLRVAERKMREKGCKTERQRERWVGGNGKLDDQFSNVALSERDLKARIEAILNC